MFIVETAEKPNAQFPRDFPPVTGDSDLVKNWWIPKAKNLSNNWWIPGLKIEEFDEFGAPKGATPEGPILKKAISSDNLSKIGIISAVTISGALYCLLPVFPNAVQFGDDKIIQYSRTSNFSPIVSIIVLVFQK
jgi:hypothetical protein